MKEWFFHRGEIGRLAGIPGVRFAKGTTKIYEIHRTHLPFLDYQHPQAPKPLTDLDRVWEARDARTKPLGFTLRTTQQTAIDYITQRRGTLLGDDMRLGKTLTAIMSHDPARGPLVVCAPLTARAVWLGWLRRVFPDEPIGVAIGTKLDPEILKHKIVFIHYPLMRFWQALFPIGTLVFDEAHVLTNPQSKIAKAASLLASRAAMVISMTGTPIWNMPPDLWQILTIAAPRAWGSIYDFSQRYGNPQQTAYGPVYEGISNGEELNARLGEIMLRRTWREAGGDIPAISRNVTVVDVDERSGRQLDIIAASLREDRGNTAAHLASYRKAVSKFKVATATAEAIKIRDRAEPVVVWTWHVDTAKAIAEKIPGSFLIHGDLSITKREDIIAAWKATPNGVMVANMAVAQVAVDFSHARQAIFAELDYTPAMIAQAEMRTFHPSRGMCITFVVLNHVVDQRLVIALEKKLSAASPVGVGAATEAINSLRVAMFGEKDEGDLARFMDDLFADCD